MKKAIIVHGWGFNPKMNWYLWLKKELEKRGYKVIVPEMPNSQEPEIKVWTGKLREVIGEIDKETILIGHSIGCQTIMRYLESLSDGIKIKNIIFIAGWFKLNNLENEEVEKIAAPWTGTKIDFNKVKSKIVKLTVFLSSNEPYNYVDENKEIFEQKLGAKVIILKNKGHFTEDDGVRKLPEILQFIE